MNGLFSGAAARAALRSAHACLAELHDTVGVTGLAAADANPGLMAVVDQHTAGIRDSLSADVRPLTAVLLAAYAAVAEASRGEGTGRALLDAMVGTAVDRGARRVFLEVRADNPVAQHLYTVRGFRPVGRRPRYYQPDGVDAVVMRLDLEARS